MPTYTIRNKEFGTEKDVFCTYSELQEMLKSDDIEQVLSAPALVGDHIVKQGDGKMDGGMKEVFSKISDAHPHSDLADRYGKKTAKQAKSKAALDKIKKKYGKITE